MSSIEAIDLLSEHESLAGLAEVLKKAPEALDESSSLSPERWGQLVGASRDAVSSGYVYTATFRPLLAPFTAEVGFRPMPHNRINRNVDIELDAADSAKLNGFINAAFILGQTLESPIAGRERYLAKLIPPYPIHAPKHTLLGANRDYARRTEKLKERASRHPYSKLGQFAVTSEGTSIRVVAEGDISEQTGRTDLYVMNPKDYDYVQHGAETPVLTTNQRLEDYGPITPITWEEEPNFTAFAVQALKARHNFRYFDAYNLRVLGSN